MPEGSRNPISPVESEASGEEREMANLLCLLFGHQKRLVPLSSNRYYCRRCGLDFGVAGEAATVRTMPPSSETRRGAGRLHR